MSSYKNPADKSNTENLKAIIAWVKDIFDLGEGSAIVIKEVQCADERCPCVETVILMINGYAINKIKIQKPLVFVKLRDIEQSNIETIIDK